MNIDTGRRPSGAGTTRRALLLGIGAALPLCAARTRPARAAEFTYKFATDQDPTHPNTGFAVTSSKQVDGTLGRRRSRRWACSPPPLAGPTASAR